MAELLVPSNIASYYNRTMNGAKLYQGDVLDSKGIGFSSLGMSSPEYWMIITKSCDLEIINSSLPRKRNISILPLIALRNLYKIYIQNGFSALISSRVVIMAINRISKFKFKSEQIDSLLKDSISKFMFLPPDGLVFTEPMIIDFDAVCQINGSDPTEVQNAISSKLLELASPFRERVAQRFAEHYASIGIDDRTIRNTDYVKAIKRVLFPKV